MNISIPEDLIKARRGRLMVVMMGAGVSAAAGLPTWKDLLENMIESCLKQPTFNNKNKISESKDRLLVNDILGSASLIYNSFDDPK
ncbi:MAG: hypothetical protein GF364_08630, partial [Candidatus Lokiarchaeota archaeon]|nr:hypothetical protein [Candidatus Lokiarchaeota archaeon]